MPTKDKKIKDAIKRIIEHGTPQIGKVILPKRIGTPTILPPISRKKKVNDDERPNRSQGEPSE